jgi:hypothetical protein
MLFFEIGARPGYASYSLVETGEFISDARIIPPYRVGGSGLSEYMGLPPRSKPGRKGNFHVSAGRHFADGKALALIEKACRGRIATRPTPIEGRDAESFMQFWVLNFVDCLDRENTVASPSAGFYKAKIGVIKRAAFDERRWDGSDLFCVPEDPSYALFCTERFVADWRSEKLKGAAFSRFLFDPEAILA